MEPECSLPHLQVLVTLSLSWASSIQSIPHTSHFLESHLNIILPTKTGSSKWPLSFRFPHQNPVYTSPIPHKCYMPRPSHSSRFDHPNNIWWAVQSLSSSICCFFFPFPCYLISLRLKYLPQHHIHQHPQSTYPSQCELPSSTSIQSRQNYSSAAPPQNIHETVSARHEAHEVSIKIYP